MSIKRPNSPEIYRDERKFTKLVPSCVKASRTESHGMNGRMSRDRQDIINHPQRISSSDVSARFRNRGYR